LPTPTTVKFQFDTFSSDSSGGGAMWSNPGNAETADGQDFATADLSGVGATTSELLVATGADLSSIPGRAVVQSVKVNIKGKVVGTGDARIHEIFAWDGSAVQGRNQAGDFDLSPNSPIELNGTNTVHTRGAAGWLWWWIERLKDSSNGVAIRAERISGGPTVEIDHIEFEITYIELFQKWPEVDYRVIAYDRLAGHTDNTTDKNENDEIYRPGAPGGHSWHSNPTDAVNAIIDTRTGKAIKRLVLGTPAGHIGGPTLASAQWEPMYDDQRVALTGVIPAWLADDPEREVIVYLGSRVKDPDSLNMAGAEEPDVINNPGHVETLKRILFPYRDHVGVRRFHLDNSTAIDRTKAKALFEWGRDNGMEFVMEAIPFVDNDDDVLDEMFTEVYGAYALSGFIIGDTNRDPPTVPRDENLEWSFTKGRLAVQVRSPDYTADTWDTPAKRRAFFKQFASEGYVLMPRDGDGFLDDAAAIVSAENIGRGVVSSAMGPATFSAVNSLTRFAERPRTRSQGSGR